MIAEAIIRCHWMSEEIFGNNPPFDRLALGELDRILLDEIVPWFEERYPGEGYSSWSRFGAVVRIWLK